MTHSLFIRFAGVTVKVNVPFPMVISPDLEKFIIQSGEPDEIITVSSLPQPQINQPPVFSSSTFRVCPEADGWCHSFPGFPGEDGSVCAFHWKENHNHTLYTPSSTQQLFQSTGKIAPFIVPELWLLSNERFFLHSSLVEINGHAVLFCGPSGIGKSTQAALWQQHLDAEILNGDRSVIYKKGGRFYAAGSPYSGSSGFYSPKEAPIAAIVLLGQANREIIRPAGVKTAFSAFCRESVQHSWDEIYTNKLINLLAELAATIPVYDLHCRPIPEAAKLAYNAIFTKEDK